MKKTFYILFFLIFASCTKQPHIKDYPYKPPSIPMFGQISERNFYYPFLLCDSLELKWNESSHGSFSNNSVVIEEDYIFVSDLAGNIFCYNADTAKVVGADKASGEIAVAPLLNSGFVYYVITVNDESYSKLISYNIREGERKKEIEIPGRVGNEMIIFDNSFFFVTDEGIAYMYDFYLRKKWEVKLKQRVYSSPAASKEKILIATNKGNLICLDEKSGKQIYSQKLSSGFESAIVIDRETGFIGDDKGNLIAFDIEDGSEKWRAETGAKIKAPAVHNGQKIYAANLAGSIYCFEIESGKKKWSFNSEGIFNAPAALFNNVLVQPDLNRKLLFINPQSGEIIRTMEFDGRVKLHPVYFNKTLYVGVDRGELYAYKCVD